MRIETLTLFLSIVELGSISAAAKKHHISQPAVTIQIRQLEREIGKTLLDRKYQAGNSITLTNSGEVFYSYAYKVIALMNEMQITLAQETENFNNIIIGTGLTVGTYIAPYVIETFRKHYPQIPVELKMYQGKTLLQSMIAEKFDVLLSSINTNQDGYISEPFCQDELVLISSNNNPLPESITLNKLTKLPLIIRENGSIARTLLEINLSKHKLKFEGLNIVMEAFTNEAVKQSVEVGMGFGFVARSSVLNLSSAQNYRIINVKGLKIERNLYLTRKVSNPSTSLRYFRSFALSNLWNPYKT